MYMQNISRAYIRYVVEARVAAGRYGASSCSILIVPRVYFATFTKNQNRSD
jgi:hypothetical protein